VRLDGLVAAKERVLGLLAEKRRALITCAVTHGLDLRTPFRDSGSPWLGDIPAHWAATRLKFVAEVRGGLTLGKNYGTAKLGEYPYLRVANV
jgi:type I restriction enzyme, S subunit